MSDEQDKITLSGSLPQGHLIVGYIAHLKVLDERGDLYFAIRARDVNDMEALGLATDMADTFQRDIGSGRVPDGGCEGHQ